MLGHTVHRLKDAKSSPAPGSASKNEGVTIFLCVAPEDPDPQKTRTHMHMHRSPFTHNDSAPHTLWSLHMMPLGPRELCWPSVAGQPWLLCFTLSSGTKQEAWTRRVDITARGPVYHNCGRSTRARVAGGCLLCLTSNSHGRGILSAPCCELGVVLAHPFPQLPCRWLWF